MEIRLDTKLEVISSEMTKASVHMDFGGGSFTISNILLKKLDNGNWCFTLPLIKIGTGSRPVITLQDGMKRAVYQALSEDHAAMRMENRRKIANSRAFTSFPTGNAGSCMPG